MTAISAYYRGSSESRCRAGRARVVIVQMALFLLSSAVCVCLAEALARVAAPRAISYPWMDSADGVTIPLPNVQGRHFVPGSYDTQFSFSSQRFRGQELYAPAPAEGTTRIAVLGSSFVFGSGANDNETYPFQLQSILNSQRRDQSDPRFEVINAGIPGTVVAQQAWWYDRWVSRFHPRLVVLNLSCVVDFPTSIALGNSRGSGNLQAGQREPSVKGGSIRRFVRRSPGYIFLSEHSELFNLLLLKLGEIIKRKSPISLAVGFEQRMQDHRIEELQAGLSREIDALRWLKQQTAQSGASMAVVLLPCHENLDGSRSPEVGEIRREYTAIEEVGHQLEILDGIPFLDVAAGMAVVAQHASHPLYYTGWCETHPTPAGYRAIAEGVAGFLKNAGLLSDPSYLNRPDK